MRKGEPAHGRIRRHHLLPQGLAKGDHKWADLFLIWADDPDVPGLKKDMGPLTEKALGYCQGR